MAGIPQPRHFGERTGGTVAIVEFGVGTPEFVRHRVGHLRFTECALDLTDCSDAQETLRLLRVEPEGIREPEHHTAIRLQVTIGHHTAEMLMAFTNEVLENIDRVFVDKSDGSRDLECAASFGLWPETENPCPERSSARRAG